jgi:hypothetical protein
MIKSDIKEEELIAADHLGKALMHDNPKIVPKDKKYIGLTLVRLVNEIRHLRRDWINSGKVC